MPSLSSSNFVGRRERNGSRGMTNNAYVSPYSDDEYLEQIAQYKDKSYYQYLLTNPWLWSKQGQFSPNLGQQILGAFGDDSAEQNYINTIQSNRSQWLSEALERFRQEDYNSPINQVARESAAGLNPDLNGNIDAGSAAENDQPILGTPQFGPDGSIQAIGSFLMSAYSMASGFAKDVVSMKSMFNQLASEDLDLNEKVVKSATEFVKGAVGIPMYSDGQWTFPDLSLDKVESYARENFSSRIARRRFVKEVNSSYSSARDRFVKMGAIKNAHDAHKAVADSLGFYGSVGSKGGDDLQPLVDVFQELNGLDLKIQKYQKNYTSDYLHSASGDTAAQAENATNQGVIQEQESRSYQRGMDKIINETMNKIVSDLEKDSKEPGLGGIIAKGMLMFISAYRMQLIPSLPSVNLKGLVQNKNFYNTTNNSLGFD